MSEEMVNDAAVQVLTERVSNLLDDIREMKGQLNSVNQGVVVMASLQERVSTLDGKTNRLFDLHDSTRSDIEGIKSQVHTQGRMWKLLGSGLMACVGVIAWGASQYQGFHELATRVTLLERASQERSK